MSRKSLLTQVLLGGACLTVAGSGTAFAQNNTQAGASSGSEEIVVTAQRREQAIQDVPIAVSRSTPTNWRTRA